MLMLKRVKLTLSVLSLLLSLVFVRGLSIPPVKAAPAVFQGDLTLGGDNVTTIHGTFHINGSILVEDNATLVLQDALVNFTQTNAYQYGLVFQNPADGQPRLQCENATLTSSLAFLIEFYDNSSADAFELTSSNADLEAHDSSNLAFLNSSIPRLMCLDHSVVSIVNTEIPIWCQTWADSHVTLVNCELGSLKPSESSTVTISDSSLWGALEVQSSSINCSIIDLADGFTSSWNYLHDCSVAIGADGSAPNLTVTDTYIAWWTFSLGGGSNATIHNSEIVYLSCTNRAAVHVTASDILGIYAYHASNISISHSTLNFVNGYGSSRVQIQDINMSSLQSQHSSTFWLANSTCDAYYIEDQSAVYVHWYLDIHVTDSLDQPVPSATVTAYYPNATTADSKLTDLAGWARLILLEKTMNATGATPIGTYTVEATYSSYANETTVSMTENQQATLTLEDFIVPEFPSLVLLPLSMILTLLAAACYSKRRFQ